MSVGERLYALSHCFLLHLLREDWRTSSANSSKSKCVSVEVTSLSICCSSSHSGILPSPPLLSPPLPSPPFPFVQHRNIVTFYDFWLGRDSEHQVRVSNGLVKESCDMHVIVM